MDPLGMPPITLSPRGAAATVPPGAFAMAMDAATGILPADLALVEAGALEAAMPGAAPPARPAAGPVPPSPRPAIPAMPGMFEEASLPGAAPLATAPIPAPATQQPAPAPASIAAAPDAEAEEGRGDSEPLAGKEPTPMPTPADMAAPPASILAGAAPSLLPPPELAVGIQAPPDASREAGASPAGLPLASPPAAAPVQQAAAGSAEAGELVQEPPSPVTGRQAGAAPAAREARAPARTAPAASPSAPFPTPDAQASPEPPGGKRLLASLAPSHKPDLPQDRLESTGPGGVAMPGAESLLSGSFQPSPAADGIRALLPHPAAPPAPARPAPRAIPAEQVAPVAIALALGGGAEGRISISLDPVELGRVEVVVERLGDAAHVQVAAERPETLALLARDGATLDRALGGAGIGGEGGRSLSFSLLGGDAGGSAGGAMGDQGERPRGGGQGAWRGPASAGGEAPARRHALLGLLDIAI
ncbi:flagellar hook-length control protein FliK [Roseomonas sp. SSH11]|uniref:Flagellar hook-length control protein FliK n=1 Tax=Pararoseomonas baculiformis TaxID=2820812 RepID=A0ABS4AER8_9PROT|nr:flagellar hook-length control protein FliK [Pararoseomonas baculiformis]MBP0445499.1 flagellar hook-length control protein FliK [Pararoseomonas baculiformis]